VEQIAALHALHSTAHEAALRPAPRLPAPAAQAITTRIHALWASQQPESTLLAQPLLFRELLEDRGALRARAKRTAQPQTPTTQLRLL
jgi:hypothetical protein